MEPCQTKVDVLTLDIALTTEVMAYKNADLDSSNRRTHHLEMDMTPSFVCEFLASGTGIKGPKALIA